MGLPLLSSLRRFNSSNNNKVLLVPNHVLDWGIGKQMVDGVFLGVKIVIGEK
jgi:hypothetical protein